MTYYAVAEAAKRLGINPIADTAAIRSIGFAARALRSRVRRQARRMNYGSYGVVDYYELISGDCSNVTIDGLQRLVSVLLHENTSGRDPETAMDTITDLLFDMSGEWVEKRTRIAAEARAKSDNPKRRNDYCFTSIRNEVEEAFRKKAEEQESPELHLVRRQVGDHLRSLRMKRVLLSFDVKQKSGKLVCVMWGLVKWEPKVRDRIPSVELEELRGSLPAIRAVEDGKGVFEYAKVLPSYLPRILDDYNAVLSTSEITFTVVCRVSPPLAAVSQFDDFTLEYTWSTFPSQDEVVEGKETWELFTKDLSETERQVLEMKNQSKTIKEIAKALGLAERTVNNAWNAIQLKAERYLNN